MLLFSSAARHRSVARGLEDAGMYFGTSPEPSTGQLAPFSNVARIKLHQPDNDTARNVEKALQAAQRIGYPVALIVLGGRSVNSLFPTQLLLWAGRCWFPLIIRPDRQVLEDAIEVDVDA